MLARWHVRFYLHTNAHECENLYFWLLNRAFFSPLKRFFSLESESIFFPKTSLILPLFFSKFVLFFDSLTISPFTKSKPKATFDLTWNLSKICYRGLWRQTWCSGCIKIRWRRWIEADFEYLRTKKAYENGLPIDSVHCLGI